MPGGNVTGTTNFSYGGKQIELVRELLPRAMKVVILLNPSNANGHNYVTDAIEAGRKFNLSISVAEVARAEDLPNAFAMIRDSRPDALLVMTSEDCARRTRPTVPRCCSRFPQAVVNWLRSLAG